MHGSVIAAERCLGSISLRILRLQARAKNLSWIVLDPGQRRGYWAAVGLRTIVSCKCPTGIPSKVIRPTLSIVPSGSISSV
jgi:hypothetical protein